jgi:uncharacterized protein
MNPALERLSALQGRDSELQRLAERLRALPARLARTQEKLKAALAAVEAHRERVRQLGLARREGEREVEGLLAQERKFQAQTMQVKTNEELWALQREIAQVHAKRSDLETGVLQRMEEEEAGRGEIARLERVVADAQAQLAQDESAVAAERATLEAEQAQLAARRAALAEEVPPELRARYERVRAGRGDPAVVALVRSACGGCWTAQPPQRVQEAKQGELIVVCEFCGRLIVGVEAEAPRPA